MRRFKIARDRMISAHINSNNSANFAGEKSFWNFLAENYDETICNAEPNCAQTDPEIFYPELGANPAAICAAKKICQACVLVEPCLEFALKNREEYGIWGGKSAKERKVFLDKTGQLKTEKSVDLDKSSE